MFNLTLKKKKKKKLLLLIHTVYVARTDENKSCEKYITHFQVLMSIIIGNKKYIYIVTIIL